MKKYIFIGFLVVSGILLTSCSVDHESLMYHIEENDELLKNALGDYEVISEEFVDYWDDAGGIPFRSYYSIFKIRYIDYEGKEQELEEHVYEQILNPFNSRYSLVDKLKEYCKGELDKECRLFLIDANDRLTLRSDADNSYDLRIKITEIFEENPLTYIDILEKDEDLVEFVVENFPKANIFYLQEVDDEEYEGLQYIQGELVSNEPMWEDDYAKLLIEKQ